MKTKFITQENHLDYILDKLIYNYIMILHCEDKSKDDYISIMKTH